MDNQAVGVIVLSAWVGLWWLAVRVICGQWFGPFEWVPVAVLAFGVPLMVADVTAVSPARFFLGHLLAAWGSVAVAIDAGWLVRRLYRWRTR